MDVKTERIKAIVTLIVDVLLIYNMLAAAKGWTVVPVNYDDIYLAISAAATVFGCVWTWWFNQNVTKEAVAGTELTLNLKAEKRNEVQ